jgi:cathepsin L
MTESYAAVTTNSDNALMASIDLMPTSVAIQANTTAFQSYSSGVLSSGCGFGMLDHAVVANGYDSTASQPYWNVRNSWAASWGDQGYIKIAMVSNVGGNCGIRKNPYNVTTKAWTGN